MQLLEGCLDCVGGSALLVDIEDPSFKVDAGLNRAQHIVRGPEDPAEEVELLFEKLVDAAVGFVALVQKIDDDNIVLLAVTMTPAYALLDALRIPRKIVVDHERTELKVDALRASFGGNEDLRVIAKAFDDGRPDINGAGARKTTAVPVLLDPAFVNVAGIGIAVGAVECQYVAGVAVTFEKLLQIGLTPAGFRKNDGLSCCAHLRHALETDLNGFEQRTRLGVNADAACPANVVIQLGNLSIKLGEVNGPLFRGLFSRGRLGELHIEIFLVFEQFIEQVVVDVLPA